MKPLLKVILVGASSVGKTCLVRSFFEKRFDEHTTPSVLPGYLMQTLTRSDGALVDLQVWDTAGQERYDAVSQLFFRDADVAFICCEAGSKESLEGVGEWVAKVRNQVATCVIVFVLTKCDLVEKDKLQEFTNEAREFLRQFEPADVAVTSAKTRVGVEKLFKGAVELCRPQTVKKMDTRSVEEERPTKMCC